MVTGTDEIEVARYVAAFRTWARVSKPSREERALIEQGCQHLESTFTPTAIVAIEKLCHELRAWFMARRDRLRHRAAGLGVTVSKSNLLARLIYYGEPLRTRRCPIHRGKWSGCFEECPAGCTYDQNVTGWLANDFVDDWPALDEDPRRDELAVQLQRDWTREHAVAYGEHLRARGDFHGELVTLDLVIEQDPSPMLRKRRRALLKSWLAPVLDAPHPEMARPGRLRRRLVTTTRGFFNVRIENAQQVRGLFDHPAGRFLRRVELVGGYDGHEAARLLAARTHPWLTEIVIVGEHSLDAEDLANLRTSAPNLKTFEVPPAHVDDDDEC